MTVTYQDVLEVICSEVTLINENDTQHIFAINTAREAKLAYDVLAAHGFDVRLYPEAEGSKLYIIHPETANGARLPSALHYAGMLRQLLETIPQETNFTVTFANTSTQGKQISVYFPPAASSASPQVEATPLIRPPVAAAARPAAASSRPRSAGTVKYRRQKSDILSGGPELGKKYPFGIPSANDNPNEMTFSKWLSTHLFSNFTESFYAFMGMAFAALVLISLWVVVKGYLCPDLATAKNSAWYCMQSE